MKFRIVILVIVFLAAFAAKDSIYDFFQKSTEVKTEESTQQNHQIEQAESTKQIDYYINDSVYIWSDTLTDWVPYDDKVQNDGTIEVNIIDTLDLSEPIEIDWDMLMNNKYRLRYFSEIDMEMFSPVFPATVKALHEKTVIIKGFVIPFDVEEGLLSLSLNPNASCFFCGNASPSSVLSLYLKEKDKHYKIDAYKKFKGTFQLNSDDPNEFYYVLRNAEEVER